MGPFDMTLMLMLDPLCSMYSNRSDNPGCNKKKEEQTCCGTCVNNERNIICYIVVGYNIYIKILIKKTVAFIINVTVFFMILKHKL